MRLFFITLHLISSFGKKNFASTLGFSSFSKLSPFMGDFDPTRLDPYLFS